MERKQTQLQKAVIEEDIAGAVAYRRHGLQGESERLAEGPNLQVAAVMHAYIVISHCKEEDYKKVAREKDHEHSDGRRIDQTVKPVRQVEVLPMAAADLLLQRCLP